MSLTPALVLSSTEFFCDLSTSQIKKISAISEVQECAVHGDIYKHGERARHFYVLVEGMVKFAVGISDRNAPAGDVLRRGNVFGWAALTPPSHYRIATASCLTPCTVLAISGEELLRLMEEDHTLGFQIMKQLNLLITGTLAAFVAG